MKKLAGTLRHVDFKRECRLYLVIRPNINRDNRPKHSKPRARITITYLKYLKQNILIYVGQLIGVL